MSYLHELSREALILEAEHYMNQEKRALECMEACAGIEDPAAAIQAAGDALETVLRLPVACMYPDGPCLERGDYEECKAALNLLAPKPTTP